MGKAAAWNLTGVDRSTQAAAEEAARRAGMSVAEWLEEVVAEQAAGQGVVDDDFESFAGGGARQTEPRREARPPARAAAREHDPAEDRLGEALARLEARSAQREERAAKALESVAHWMERSEADRQPQREEPRAERETPRPQARVNLQDAIERVQRRRSENDARQGVEPPPARAARPPAGPAPAFAAERTRNEAVVDSLRADLTALQTRLEQMRHDQRPAPKQEPEAVDRRMTRGETEAIRAELAAMRRSLTELAPRNGNVALEGAIADLGRRLEAMRRSFIGAEALRPLEDMLRQAVQALRANDPLSAARNLEADLKGLSARVDELARNAVNPALIEQIRRQTEDTGLMLARAAEAATPIARLERQIETLADRTEQLASHPRPDNEIERLTAQFAETRTQIQRALSPSVLRTVEQRIEGLAERIDEALKRPAPDNSAPIADLARRIDEALKRPAPDNAAPIADLARRIDGLKATLDRQSSLGATTGKLEAAIVELGRKLERPQAPTFDPRGFEALAQRVDGLKSAVERQSALAPAGAQLEGALADVARRLEALAAAPALDGRQLGALNSRVENLRELLERQAALAPAAQKIEAAIAEIVRKLDRPAAPPRLDLRPLEELSRQVDSLKVAMAQPSASASTLAKLEAAIGEVGRKLDVATAEPRSFGELASQVENLKLAVEQQTDAIAQAAALEAQIAEIGRKLDRPPQGLADQMTIKSTLQALSARVDDGFRRIVETARAPTEGAIEMELFDEMARGLTDLRAVVDRQSEFSENASRLETAIADLASRIETNAHTGVAPAALQETLQALLGRLQEGAFPTAANGAIGDLIDRIERMRESSTDTPRHLATLAGELQNIRARLEARDPSGLTERVQALAQRLDRQEHSLSDLSALETLVREIGERPLNVDTRPIEALIDDLARRIESSANASGDIHPLLDAINRMQARLDTLDPTPIHHAIADLGERPLHVDTGPIESLIDDLGRRLERSSGAQAEFGPLLDAVGRVEARLDALDPASLKHAISDLGDRQVNFDTRPIESLIDDLGRRLERSTGAQAEFGPLLDAVNRMEARLDALDPAPLQHAIADLGGRLDAPAPTALSDDQLERAAGLIAERIGPTSGLGADMELLLKQVLQIQDRLDSIGVDSSSNAALEKSVGELVAEFEDTRKLLIELATPIARTHGLSDDIADMRTEQANAERRMSGRLGRVQEILEGLSGQLGSLAKAGNGEAAPKPQAGPAAAPAAQTSFAALSEIPDRPRSAARPASATALRLDARAAPIEPNTVGAPARPADWAEDDAAGSKANDLQAHIAAARRAAMADMNARRSGPPAPDTTAAPVVAPQTARITPFAALKQAQAALSQRRVPFLIGGALLVVAATVAISELRGGLPFIHRADITPPVPTPVASAEMAAPAPTATPKVDFEPTGSVEPAKAPSVQPAPAAQPAPATPVSAEKVPANLIAALPEGLGEPLKSALLNADPGAEIEIGLRYLEGRGVGRDAKAGALWLELAAAQNQTYAEYRVGALYERGVGVAKDPQLARAWYQKAATGGNARAMHNLAVMDAEDGGSGKPDYAEAAGGFRSAGEYGVRDSQYNLGVLYGRGLGVPQDTEQSWLWFSLAAQQGDADAARKRDEVAAKMDPKTLAEAQKKLTEFKPKTPSVAANEPPQPAGGWEPKAPAPQAAKPSPSPATKS